MRGWTSSLLISRDVPYAKPVDTGCTLLAPYTLKDKKDQARRSRISFSPFPNPTLAPLTSPLPVRNMQEREVVLCAQRERPARVEPRSGREIECVGGGAEDARRGETRGLENVTATKSIACFFVLRDS